MVRRRCATILAFVFAFIVNPAYFTGCGPTESGPKFGEADMLKVLDMANETGRWQFVSDDKHYEVELSLMETVGKDEVASGGSASLWSSTAFACGSRNFMQSASACVTSSALAVEGELVLREISPTARVIAVSLPVNGRLMTHSQILGGMNLQLDAGKSHLELRQSSDPNSANPETFELVAAQFVKVGEAGETISYAR